MSVALQGNDKPRFVSFDRNDRKSLYFSMYLYFVTIFGACVFIAVEFLPRSHLLVKRRGQICEFLSGIFCWRSFNFLFAWSVKPLLLALTANFFFPSSGYFPFMTSSVYYKQTENENTSCTAEIFSGQTPESICLKRLFLLSLFVVVFLL